MRGGDMGQTRTGKNSGARRGRVIMHLDMDAFFVNVELLENPALRGEPIEKAKRKKPGNTSEKEQPQKKRFRRRRRKKRTSPGTPQENS